ncbi:SPOR domain-containing protein [Novosphingobium sp. G106]|uniref:SPOR domain-containing protein n=1 Tax=Novosphingobium sp. G106 TaxID=2849500 RepID=UPI001C2D95C0|nr:SPOR domain-containing protein [Novosphingobium sp. G106]MBV1689166.1 SPOR domain-containing protein [Novosphingobium sp. G106]
MAIAGATGANGNGAGEHPYVSGREPHVPGEEPWDDAPLETGRLEFGDDVRLPWLETDGDEEEYQTYNAGQLVALLILGVLALAVIGGGIWWALSHRKNEAMVADGSVIAAPSQPYKERPKDAGGKTFAGTGDTAFAVSEGQTRPARLGDAPAAKPAPSPSPSASAAAAEPEASGVGVQVAAYSNRSQAEAGWTRLSGQYEALSGLKHRIVEGRADIGTVYRLQVLAGDVAGANALCSKLKAAGLACQVKH